MTKQTKYFILLCSGLAVVGFFLALSLGAKNIPLETIFESIFNFQEVLELQLVRDVRLPRVISTLFVGALLAASGAMMQGVTRNPIAEPSLMGITQGATLAIAIVSASPILYGMLGTTAAALIGATLSGLLVMLFSMRNARNMNITRLLLAGTALSTFFISLASMIAILTNKSQNLAFWVNGGFRTADWNSVLLLVVVGSITLLFAMLLSSKINIVNLGEDVAIGLGVQPMKIRMKTLLLIIPMSAICVAVAGNIAFVGLIIPHIVRKIVGQDYRKIIPISMLFGATLLVYADILARMIDLPYETPIGLFTTLIGIPIFILMVRKERS